jgi:hypothetical protein
MITEDNAGINKNDIKSWKCDIPRSLIKFWELTGREMLYDLKINWQSFELCC